MITWRFNLRPPDNTMSDQVVFLCFSTVCLIDFVLVIPCFNNPGAIPIDFVPVL